MSATDVRTHIEADVPAARWLHDVMVYHMMITSLTVRAVQTERVFSTPTPEETKYGITRAIPYLKYIKNTSIYYIMPVTVKDIYGRDKEITPENRRELDRIIALLCLYVNVTTPEMLRKQF